MSLINQMLQDLDKRGSDGIQAHEQYAQLGVIATPKSRASWYWMIASVLMIALVAWVFLHKASSDEPLAASNANAKANANANANGDALAAASVAALSMVAESPSDVQFKQNEQIEKIAESEKLEHLAGQANVPTLFQLSTQLSSPTSSTNTAEQAKPSTTEMAQKNSEQTKPILVVTPSVAPNNVANNAANIAANNAANNAINKASITTSVINKEKVETIKTSPLVKEVTAGQKAEGEYRQATLYYQQGRSADAMHSLEQALKIDPKHSAARQLLVSLHLEQNHHEDAIQQLKLGLQHDAEQMDLAMMLARLYVEKNKVKEAINVMQKALPRGQEKGEFLAFLATLKQRDGQSAEAVELYRAALRKSPENSSWWMGMGIAFMSLGQSNSALEAFKQAKNFRNLSPELLAFVDQKILFLQQ